MCGIVGAIMPAGARDAIFEGLERLEYRGYDSAGIAFADRERIRRARVAGRVADLRKAAISSKQGAIGIGHTRWATHGGPERKNAHPLTAGRVAVVHNGVIENHAELRRELLEDRRRFSSDTDTEVFAHLLDIRLREGDDEAAAMRRAVAPLRGSFAVAAVASGREKIMCARRGAPLAAAKGREGVFIASDARALGARAEKIAFMEDGDIAILSEGRVAFYDATGRAVSRKWRAAPKNGADATRGGHAHFMRKEMLEQPGAVLATLEPLLSRGRIVPRYFGPGASASFERIQSAVIAGCGTSFHAGLCGRRWMEELAGIPCGAEIASEYRGAPRARPRAGDLLVAVSQSGETADTLGALRDFRAAGRGRTLAICNTAQSAMAREAHMFLPTRAGVEIGVASTKTFTAQLAALAATALAMARSRRIYSRSPTSETAEKAAMGDLDGLPDLLRRALDLEEEARGWARRIAKARGMIFVARGRLLPLALEGALKMKELSYIYAEGCAAGELKHGTLALVERGTPVIGLAGDDEWLPKTSANLAEAEARGGKLYVLAGKNFQMKNANIIRAPSCPEWLSPFAFAPPLQMLAYHTALTLGADIDKPRNLAKSVTVE